MWKLRPRWSSVCVQEEGGEYMQMPQWEDEGQTFFVSPLLRGEVTNTVQ